MKRLLVAMLLAAAAAAPVHAQMAAAIGKPLPSPDLEVGTVSVRVVAGAPSDPVVGTEVTLVVNGATRVARTDTAGRAFFKDLPAGAQIQAKVAGDDKEIASETFPLPAQGGVRLMLTTRPWNPGAGAAGAAPAAGGAAPAGMPNPRQMSGEPQPETSVTPGSLTVRLAYDDFKDIPPAGTPVTLVGYFANDLIDMQVAKTDAEGRATFTGLDRTGSVSYFALTLLERGGKLERLMSIPAILDSRSGVRIVLSGEKRTSTAPPADDLTRFEKQDSPPPPGKVRVALEGGVEATAVVSLIEISEGKPTQPGTVANERRVFASGKPRSGPPDPSQVQAQADFKPRTDLPANTLVVTVKGGVNATMNPLEGIGVNVSPAANAAAELGEIDGTTNATGTTTITVAPGTAGPLTATLTINGKPLTSKPFDLAQSGGELAVEAHWSSEGKPEVVFDVVPRPGQVFYAETKMHGQLYRSLPFQPVPDRGTNVTLFIYPRVLFTFSLTSRVDDEYLAVNGRFELSNNAWAPYLPANSDGIMIPLPKGFIGGLVAEKDQAEVAIVPGEGFRVIRPLAPGSKQFHGAFSLPVKEGGVSWRLDLPYGSFNSGMEILQPPGMTVETPRGVDGKTMTVPQGTFFVLPQISILPKQSMVMSLKNLPQPPGWKIWMPRIVGLAVMVLIVGGVLAALIRKPAPTDAERQARRQTLLDELVELERTGSSASGKAARRREQIMAELESLWDAA